MKDTIRFLKFEHFSGVLELFQALVKGSATRMIHHMIWMVMEHAQSQLLTIDVDAPVLVADFQVLCSIMYGA